MSIKSLDLVDVKITGKRIVVSIPFKYLPCAVDNALANHLGEDEAEGWKITNRRTLAESIVAELTAEQEDGTTLVHTMLDQAIANALDNGREGIDERAGSGEND